MGGAVGGLVTGFCYGGTGIGEKWGKRGSRECGEPGGEKEEVGRGRGSEGGLGGTCRGGHIWDVGREKGPHICMHGSGRNVPTRVCTSGSPRAFTSGGLLGHSWGGGRLFHIWGTEDLRDVHIWGMQLHSDQQLGMSLMSQLGTQLKAHLENQVVSICAHLGSSHIWRACPGLLFHTQSCAEAADR